jgi:ABC-type enterochelin transport system permease subunit
LKKGANYSKDHLADQLALEIRDYAESINYKFTIYQKIAAWFMGKVAQFLNLLPRSLYISIRKIYIKFALPT